MGSKPGAGGVVTEANLPKSAASEIELTALLAMIADDRPSLSTLGRFLPTWPAFLLVVFSDQPMPDTDGSAAADSEGEDPHLTEEDSDQEQGGAKLISRSVPPPRPL